MEPWRTAFRAISEQLTDSGLTAIERAIKTDDMALQQGATVYPPADYDGCERQALAACPIGFAFMADNTGATAAQVDAHFNAVISSPALASTELGAYEFLRWWDDGERQAVRRQLLPEIKRLLAARSAANKRAAHVPKASNRPGWYSPPSRLIPSQERRRAPGQSDVNGLSTEEADSRARKKSRRTIENHLSYGHRRPARLGAIFANVGPKDPLSHRLAKTLSPA